MTIKQYLTKKYGFTNDAIVPKEFLAEELLDLKPPRCRAPLKFGKFCDLIEERLNNAM